MKKPFITLTSDFGVQSQGVGIMEAVIREIAPDAHVIHLMHGLPSFDIRAAARTMETLRDVPVGFHVCVVDPGVGTARKPIIIQTHRGDFLIGPDNGVLLPGARILGGIKKIVAIENPHYMKLPLSPIFHGKGIFAPTAAHLSLGVALEEFGAEINPDLLAKAPYEEALHKNGVLFVEVIYINKFGSLHLNVFDRAWDEFGAKKNEIIKLHFNNQKIVELPCVETFGEVAVGSPLILKDDYGRVEVALNRGNFSQEYDIHIGDSCTITKKISLTSAGDFLRE